VFQILGAEINVLEPHMSVVSSNCLKSWTEKHWTCITLSYLQKWRCLKQKQLCIRWSSELFAWTDKSEVDERLTNYAAKHVMYHLTDAGGRHADNVARVLCSLRFVQLKLKLVATTVEIPEALRCLLDDYQHCHYQVDASLLLYTAIFCDSKKLYSFVPLCIVKKNTHAQRLFSSVLVDRKY